MATIFAFVDAHGNVKGIMSPGADDQFVQGQTYGDTVAAIITDALKDDNTLMLTKWFDVSDTTWKTKTASTGDYYNWESAAWVLDSTRLFTDIRNARDVLLDNSDWTQMVDSPLTDAKKAEWVTYRTALRDVPATNASVTDIADITWPTEPS